MEVGQLFVPVERKSLITEGDRRGEFTGMASVFNVVDLHNDIVLPGAFADTIKASGGRVKLLYQHDPTRPIGVGEVTETSTGLAIRGRLSLVTRDAVEAYGLMLDGVLDGLSIGYETKKAEKPKNGVRRIAAVSLHEVSIVTFPANVAATIGMVKMAQHSPLAALRQLRDNSRALTKQLQDGSRQRALEDAQRRDTALYRRVAKLARLLATEAAL